MGGTRTHKFVDLKAGIDNFGAVQRIVRRSDKVIPDRDRIEQNFRLGHRSGALRQARIHILVQNRIGGLDQNPLLGLGHQL